MLCEAPKAFGESGDDNLGVGGRQHSAVLASGSSRAQTEQQCYQPQAQHTTGQEGEVLPNLFDCGSPRMTYAG